MTTKQAIPVRQLTRPGNSSSELKVLNLARLLKQEGLTESVHRHDFYFLLIITEGHGTHTIDFNTYKTEPGMVFLLRPGQIHELNLRKGGAGFVLQFAGDFVPHASESLRKKFKIIGQHNVISFTKESLAPIAQSAEKIYAESQTDAIEKNEAIRLHLHLIFIELYRRLVEQESVSRQGGDDFNQQQLYTFLELLEQNFHLKKRVSDYADMMNLTPYQLNNITRSALNKSVSKLINDQILLEAKRLLLTTSHQVNHIAFDLGFEDPSYFIRFFKKHLGASPTVFRQNFK